ncbi:MAG: cytochrome c oxidase subunit 3 [Thermaerobacter sp.]|nr:cytochrome c oxidase subunit 3 [Thermaerobacter sp.]
MSQAVRRYEETEQHLPIEFADYHESVKITGFWFFLATDLLLFASLFGTFAVMRFDFAQGATPAQLFHYGPLILETLLLLTSSFTCGLAIYQMRRNNQKGMLMWLIVTILLGMGFVGTEVHEFVSYVGMGATWHKSGFLSAFFTLVGTHGAHVTVGILWALTLVVQLVQRGITPRTSRKLFTFALYWHFLDIVWVFIFSFVYLSSMTGGRIA